MTAGPFFRESGARLVVPLSEELAGIYPAGDDFARFQLPAIHAYDKAHVVGLTESGVIPPAAGAAILGALRRLDQEGALEVRLAEGGYLHSGEQWLRSHVGAEVAGWIHLGRSSGDLTTVSLRMTQRAMLRDYLTAAIELNEVLLEVASAHAEHTMVAYTHLQHAQHSTLGHEYAAWAAEGIRRLRGVQEFLSSLSASPAGAAVGTGSPFALPVDRIGALLGFDSVFVNSRDSNFGMDFITECVSQLALSANVYARLANEIMLWASDEFGYVDVPEEFCTTSSILPQKKNPIALQFVRGVAGTTAGALTSALHITSHLADTVIIDREMAAHEMWRSLVSSTQAARVLGPLVAGLEFDVVRMKHVAEGSWAAAYDLAVVFVEAGLNWREAHDASAAVVRRAVDAGMVPRDLTAAWLDAAARELELPRSATPERMLSAFDPADSVASKRVPGGPRPDDVRHQVERMRAELDGIRAENRRQRERVDAAEALLEGAIDALLERATVDS